MTIALLRSEIHRFLQDATPEVVCIRGRWGVGKTFAWLKYLGEIERAGGLKVNQYAYVSLFGLNSLNDLRYAIFESTVTTDQYLDGPDVSTLGALLAKGMDWGRKTRPFLDSVGSVLGRKDAGEALARASFLLVRKQLVCFDDLERAGDGLKQRDILGLASFLKEQRKCKVVLLLNDEQMEEQQRKEFDRQLEKVVDVNLRFDPTSAEATAIALDEAGEIGAILAPLVVKLGIVNIRVIKKIERMAKLLRDLLAPYGDQVVGQAAATVTLGGWCVLQPDVAPNLDFLKTFREVAFGMRALEGGLTPEEEKWRRLVEDYGYRDTDELDEAILDGVARGAFDENRVREEGRKLQLRFAEGARVDTFSDAWSQFHGNLEADDDKILDDLYQGALENLTRISPPNINGTVRLFRDVGQGDRASDLIAKYVDANQDDRRFFDLSESHFMADDVKDPELVKAFQEKLSTFTDERDPCAVLKEIASRRGWNREDVELLSKVSPDGFVEIFENIRGSELRHCIEFAQIVGAQGYDAANAVGASVKEALERIAARSPLRAFRLRRYGIGGDGQETEDGDSVVA